jgi:uncharacterized protein YodC (DUF2158 family)
MFSVGDTVRLKSGSPIMTVEAVDHHEGKNMVHCVWFDDKKQLQRQTFPMAIVEKS